MLSYLLYNFQNFLKSGNILKIHCNINFSHRSPNFKRNSPLDTSTWNMFTLCGRLNQFIAQRVCEFQIALPNKLTHLKITLPLWNTCGWDKYNWRYQKYHFSLLSAAHNIWFPTDMLICRSSRVCIEHYPVYPLYKWTAWLATVIIMNQILAKTQDISQFCVSIHNLSSMFPFLKQGQI